jgi:DNA-binding NtrC family response regulator
MILLVDNDPLRAFLRKSILEQRFSDVQRVGDAAEALCLVEEPSFARDLGLVISALRTPGFGGPGFVAELHARLPRLRILVLGNSNEAANEYDGDWVRFLSKPVNNEEMLSLASEMMAQTGKLEPVALGASRLN